MVEFGSQIKAVQGDEPGEAVMLNDSGEIPSSGGMKWTRIPYNSTLEAGRIYKVITTLGSAEFMPSSNVKRVLFPGCPYDSETSGTSNSWGRWITISNMKLGHIMNSTLSSGYDYAASENNCALFVLEE